jgi:ribosome maturation factor RimP
MTDRKKIETWVRENLEEGIFLVEVHISKSNVITIYMDSREGVTIDQCAVLSRKMEEKLNKDTEDFELVVSSPGLGQPFKVMEQYTKNIGRKIEVVTLQGEKMIGKLEQVGETDLTIQSTETMKTEGTKKTQRIKKEFRVPFKNIKTAKTIISFNGR